MSMLPKTSRNRTAPEPSAPHSNEKREDASFYEAFHRRSRLNPIEDLKQGERLRGISRLIPPGSRNVLFVGCGQGEELELVQGRVVALDLALSGLQAARRRKLAVGLLAADACRLPFPDGGFDTVICSEVLEHLPAAAEAISEIHRVLRPDGWLLVTTPNWWSLFGLARAVAEAVTREPVTSGGQPYDHWRTPRALGSLLAPHFRVVRRRGAWFYPPFGRGDRQLPAWLTLPFVRLTLPVERLIARVVPGLGHLLLVLAERIPQADLEP